MKKRILAILLIASMGICTLVGCGNTNNGGKDTESNTKLNEKQPVSALEAMELINTTELNVIEDKYRNVYEIFPYSFRDSNGDGIGDLKGIISKLDYIKDLGANALWITPVHSSLSYHKYDVLDYYSIDPVFGTMEDYEELLKQAHNRNMTVLMDLVLNHTSSSHPWFTQAVAYMKTLEEGEEPSVQECPYVDYYVFTKEFESGYHQIDGTEWYYECRFVDTMPDLNLDSEAVRKEIQDIVKFWLDKGVDGFRLDAVLYYYTGNEQANIDFLTWLNQTVKAQKPDAYIVGEAWTNSVIYTNYYESGVDSFFNFDFATKSGNIVKVIQNGTAKGFGKLIVASNEMMSSKNSNYIDAAFTSNHDNARVAGTLPGNKNQLKMAQAMAMMMGGTYFLYYGDEVGMKGSGDDENKRAPMQWSSDANAEGMCKTIATKTIEMTNGSVETQTEDPDSLLNYVKQGLKLRNTYPEIARGTNEVIEECSNEDILVLKKTYEGSELLIVMNISENANTVDLSGISINGKEAGEFEVAGTLLATAEMVGVEDATLTMPAYSIEILK